MVAGGLLKREAGGPHTIWSPNSQANKEELNPAWRIHALAVEMLRAARAMPMPTTGGHVELRIGMHTVSMCAACAVCAVCCVLCC